MSSSAFYLTASEILYAITREGEGAYSCGNDTTPNHSAPKDRAVPLDEQPVVARIQQGDESALESLFKQYYAELRAIATIVHGSSAAAGEVVDDVFTALWNIRDRWNPTYGIRAYLVRAVRNRAHSVLRAEAARNRVESEPEWRLAMDSPKGMGEMPLAPDAQLDADELARIIWNVVGGLSETARIILTLRWRHEMPWDAIAHATNLSVGAAQMHHNRACKILRQRLPKYLK